MQEFSEIGISFIFNILSDYSFFFEKILLSSKK